MSMTERLVAITENDYQKMVDNPALTDSFLFPEDIDLDKVGEKCLDLDKTWNIIYFLLSGKNIEVGDVYEPQNAAIIGGEEIGPELVYGPACIINKDEVKRVFNYLKKLPKTFVKDKFNARKIIENEVYPYAGSYSVDELEKEANEEVEYANSFFEKLIKFYQFAAENNFSVLQVIE